MNRAVRQTLTIARRDFVATVFTPIFLIFLFAPLLMASFSMIAGMGAASMADRGDKARIVAILPVELARPIAEADMRLRATFTHDDAPPPLTTLKPDAGKERAQAEAAFNARDYEPTAVMFGPLERPTILRRANATRSTAYLEALATEVLVRQRLRDGYPRVRATNKIVAQQRTSEKGRGQSDFFAVFGVFFLTLFLASQMVGTMAEERNNKVIEVLAAAVPLESVFLGKLIGMFGVAVLFVGFWGTIAGQVGRFLPPPLVAGLAEMTPAVGLPMFALLFFAYFTMAFMLLGSVFLGVGAQASTMREIQMLSLPITIVQVGMFALSSAAAGNPDSPIALVAEIFPLSSPFAMAGRAATSPEWWPHAAALAWQLLWVAIFVTVGARLFRRGVLQSGGTPFWKRRRASAEP